MGYKFEFKSPKLTLEEVLVFSEKPIEVESDDYHLTESLLENNSTLFYFISPVHVVALKEFVDEEEKVKIVDAVLFVYDEEIGMFVDEDVKSYVLPIKAEVKIRLPELVVSEVKKYVCYEIKRFRR